MATVEAEGWIGSSESYFASLDGSTRVSLLSVLISML